MRRFARFWRDRRGNFTIIFALALIPGVGVMGLAIDYGLALRMRTALNASADAAALAAITVTSNIMNSPTNNSFSYAQSQAVAAGTLVFAANANPYTVPSNLSVSVTQNPTNPLIITSTVSYNGVSPNQFGQIFGVNTMNFNGGATSSVTMNRYINIYVLVDVSQSMGIAGSSQDMATLFTATAASPSQGGGCVFGCHVLQSGQIITNEQVARNNNVTLRIDIIKSAIAGMITRASDANNVYPLDKIGLYTLEQGLTSIVDPPTSNTTTLNTQLATIDLGNQTNSGGVGDSWSSATLSSLASKIPASGDGSSPTSPQNYVFIMTDGTSDIAGSCPDGHCVTAYSTSWCVGLQNLATVGVIYTTYLPIYNNNNASQGLDQRYIDLISPIASQINPQMKSCTTPGNWFFEASNAADINTALNSLFAQASAGSRLTN